MMAVGTRGVPLGELACTYTYIHMWMYVYVYVCMHLCVCVCVSVCLCVGERQAGVWRGLHE